MRPNDLINAAEIAGRNSNSCIRTARPVSWTTRRDVLVMVVVVALHQRNMAISTTSRLNVLVKTDCHRALPLPTRRQVGLVQRVHYTRALAPVSRRIQIGRASCRERG